MISVFLESEDVFNFMKKHDSTPIVRKRCKNNFYCPLLCFIAINSFQ